MSVWSRLAAAALTLALSLTGGAEHALGDAGDPVAGLSAAQQSWFDDGKAAFELAYTAESGLGPVFNAASCVACHFVPAAGGGSDIAVTRFGSSVGGFDPLVGMGGSLLQEEAIDPACVETIPAEADVIALRITTPMFGAGLIENIPDDAILARADPDDEDGDGISGRPHMIVYPGAPKVGRFGWKAQEATLLSFTADALVEEMGITNTLEPRAPAPGGDPLLASACEEIEGADDPEDRGTELQAPALVTMTNFTRLLAPPSDAGRPRGIGWRRFRRVGCAECHVPRWRTGPHTVAALANVEIHPYSDFLLHDMGTLGDGIAQLSAGPREMRTAPLWGVGDRNRLLHDGRAGTIEEAILAHDDEGADARARYLRLGAEGRAALLEFVRER